VVMATQGYPGAYDKGSVISGLSAIDQGTDLAIFHAGTRERAGQIEAAGGRVLNVTAMAPTLAAARERAYLAIDRIDWPEGFCRRDIGWRALDHDPA
ncbi:MAG: phosphoribosylglycinamide synthetase C domain-containing protein, partial [Pseudomonadota bacterium]